jgi:hypothetical protein
MKIKIEEANKELIEKALSTINGRASEHCFNSFAEILKKKNDFENKLNNLLPKKYHNNIECICQSGKKIANAEFQRISTFIKITKFSSGFFLTNIERDTLFKYPIPDKILMNEDQKNATLKNLISTNNIIIKNGEK